VELFRENLLRERTCRSFWLSSCRIGEFRKFRVFTHLPSQGCLWVAWWGHPKLLWCSWPSDDWTPGPDPLEGSLGQIIVTDYIWMDWKRRLSNNYHSGSKHLKWLFQNSRFFPISPKSRLMWSGATCWVSLLSFVSKVFTHKLNL